VSAFDEEFQRYFQALDRAGGKDHCYICRRTAADVKAFFGFDEDGVPTHAAEFGLEDVVLERSDIMSYRGLRPVCAVCQLNFDALFALGEEDLLLDVLRQLRDERDKLWPPEG
jgi:hypothetical protein